MADAVGGVGDAVEAAGDARAAHEPGHGQGQSRRAGQQHGILGQHRLGRPEDRRFGQADDKGHVGGGFGRQPGLGPGIIALVPIGARSEENTFVAALADLLPNHRAQGLADGIGLLARPKVQTHAIVVRDAEDRTRGKAQGIKQAVVDRQVDGDEQHAAYGAGIVMKGIGKGKGRFVGHAADDIFAGRERVGVQGFLDVFAVGQVDAAMGPSRNKDLAAFIDDQEIEVDGILLEQGGEKGITGRDVQSAHLGHDRQGGKQQPRAVGDARLDLDQGGDRTLGFLGGV